MRRSLSGVILDPDLPSSYCFLFNDIFVHVYVCTVCVWDCVLQELAVSCLVFVLGAELRSSGRAATTFNHQVVFPVWALHLIYLFII